MTLIPPVIDTFPPNVDDQADLDPNRHPAGGLVFVAPKLQSTGDKSMRLRDAARVVRSKNAGPTELTIDIMFDDAALYERALRSTSLRPDVIAQSYGVADVKVIPYPAASAIKIAIPRTVIAGTPGDTDVYGAQQHRPLLDVEI